MTERPDFEEVKRALLGPGKKEDYVLWPPPPACTCSAARHRSHRPHQPECAYAKWRAGMDMETPTFKTANTDPLLAQQELAHAILRAVRKGQDEMRDEFSQAIRQATSNFLKASEAMANGLRDASRVALEISRKLAPLLAGRQYVWDGEDFQEVTHDEQRWEDDGGVVRSTTAISDRSDDDGR